MPYSVATSPRIPLFTAWTLAQSSCFQSCSWLWCLLRGRTCRWASPHCLLRECLLSRTSHSIAPLAILVVFTALLNIFFVQGGEVYFQLWIICINQQGLHQALFIAIRLTMLLLGVSLLTLATTTLDLTDGFERLLEPFKRFGLPAHELSMMMGIALRFLPQFAIELRTIYRAQISRGANFGKGPKGGVAMMTSLIVPLFTSAFRHAETLSLGMDARCYHGGENRTRLKELSFSKRDIAGTVYLGIGTAAVLATDLVLNMLL